METGRRMLGRASGTEEEPCVGGYGGSLRHSPLSSSGSITTRSRRRGPRASPPCNWASCSAEPLSAQGAEVYNGRDEYQGVRPSDVAEIPPSCWAAAGRRWCWCGSNSGASVRESPSPSRFLSRCGARALRSSATSLGFSRGSLSSRENVSNALVIDSYDVPSGADAHCVIAAEPDPTHAGLVSDS